MRRAPCAVLLAALLLCLAPLAHADRREDLYKQAVKAGTAGQIEEAARLYCEVAKLDAKYLDSKQMCALWTSEAERERKRNDDRYAEGVKAFQDGRFDEAEQKFRNVRGGSHLDEAKQYLARIPAARAEKAGAEADNTRYEQAVQAYQRNDFGAAKSLLSQVGGGRKGEAQNYLGMINRYEQAMSAGDNYAGANKPQQALTSYAEAMGIKADGPGDPRGKVARMQTLLSSAGGGTTAGSGGGTTTTTTTVPAKRIEVATAVKETKPVVDTKKLLREAETAEKKGQTGIASGKYLAVLAADPGNLAARRALDALSSQNQTSKQAAGSEADVMLAKGIREFYTGLYEEAEVHIKDYLNANGAKTGLSQFYLGASKLTRYYLAGESERRLLTDAQAAFQLAKQTAGFRPPDEHFISPKILKAYKEAR